MLTTRTAYPITPTNAQIIANISGHSLKTITANVGWYATFSETRFPRWQIVPNKAKVDKMGFTIDEETYP